ncbi:trehalose/maltose import ATP-binding protein MalK [Halalkalicoccus paucihalophilus]|uniref:Molybdate/tungstate import ATP-binding protein WtpC n=1 Tax=Halalkalicoccus paucihalophilus TaxID=1008153 RepID=A0A151ADI1_9EURY|nr:ABC transporter ATP-binding protein [Halalkalicoccus paucihalophilus]KYH25417.1 trehalose/maltose import ATP-binding protein MalK [Halalkalicoccus paucihalophilus]
MAVRNDQSERSNAGTDGDQITDDRVSGSAEAAVLEIDGVTKRFGAECAVNDLSLSVREGELLTLLGPSGCGKTTTLRLIAGLERPDDGEVRVDGERVAAAEDGTFVPPERRDVGVVFQDFALFPHLSAAENVAFGLDDWDAEAREAHVDELLELVGLTDHADSKPNELSGGQQQRIALARSLAPEPDILLLDEPFSNLDVDLRVEMREEVRRILTEAGVTGISVTHDQEEAMSISDRVAVMHDGALMQVGDPAEVFQHPQSRFVAGFLGHASFVPGYVTDDLVETSLGNIGRDRIHGLAPEYDRTRIDVLVRPDDVLVRPADGGEADGRVTYRRYLGPTVLYRVELEDGTIVEAMHNHAQRVSLDTPVTVELAATHDLSWFPTEDH